MELYILHLISLKYSNSPIQEYRGVVGRGTTGMLSLHPA